MRHVTFFTTLLAIAGVLVLPEAYGKEAGRMLKSTKEASETKAPKAPKETKDPSMTKAPKATKSPKGTKGPKATKSPKGTKAPKATKSPKETKAPKATKSPKETKAPKATKSPKATKAPKRVLKSTKEASETTNAPLSAVENLLKEKGIASKYGNEETTHKVCTT